MYYFTLFFIFNSHAYKLNQHFSDEDFETPLQKMGANYIRNYNTLVFIYSYCFTFLKEMQKPGMHTIVLKLCLLPGHDKNAGLGEPIGVGWMLRP